jgi:hypothetical protein
MVPGRVGMYVAFEVMGRTHNSKQRLVRSDAPSQVASPFPWRPVINCREWGR